MPHEEFVRLELLSELDGLVDRLKRWAQTAPDWQPAQTCQAMVRRLQQRIEMMRIRWEAPLVVAVMGGSGTGKSALINAILGEEVVEVGRQRPTTCRPAIVCRPEITLEMLGIDPAGIELLVRDLPMLRDLVLVDCPDPDTTEERSQDYNRITCDTGDSPAQAATAIAPGCPDSNLARLRQILPHCDVLLVTTTQQKYRSARVAEELGAAAAGARLVFVQTHAAVDDDIREDWRAVLADQYASGRIFFVDSLSAMAEAQAGRLPRGEMADLLDLLLRELAGAASSRIRRANFLDLLAETLAGCQKRLAQAAPPVEQLAHAIEEQRGFFAALLAKQMHAELLASRRTWENRLLERTATRWGAGPFAWVLRIYQGLGTLALSALVLRARTPAQMALWGTAEGVYAWRKQRQRRQYLRGIDRAVGECWEQAEIQKAALILEGYAAEAGVDRHYVAPANVATEARAAGASFLARAAADLEALVARLAARHTGWFTRGCYELLLLLMFFWLLFPLAKNFFYDSWLASPPQPRWGLDVYLTAGFWFVLWCLLLIFLLTRRLRGGLRREIDQLVVVWQSPATTAGLFAGLESKCHRTQEFCRDLEGLQQQVQQLQRQLALPEEKIGHHL